MENKITIQEAVNVFASQIHHDLVDLGGSMNWRDAVVNMHWDSRNSKDGFNAFYDHGCRSIISIDNRLDSTYHICEEQTEAVNKYIKQFDSMFFDDRTARYDQKELDEYYDQLNDYISETRATVVIDTWYYTKDNINNKSGKDKVLIQVHVNPDDQIRFISATGKDAYIAVFDSEEFIRMINNKDVLVLKINECLSGDAFIDPQSDLIK
jgi:hypothetical protein